MRRIFSLVLALGAVFPEPVAALDGEFYRNPRHGLKFTAPPGWLLSRQTGYPEVLAIMTRAQAGDVQLSVALAALDRAGTLERVVEQNNRAMRAVGLTVQRSARVEHLGRRIWRVAAIAQRPDEPEMTIEQLYLAGPERIVILTLACPSAALKRHRLALDTLLESVELSTPEPPAPR